MSPSGRTIATHLAALAAAIGLGVGTGWLGATYGQADPRVIGPLFAPLSIGFAFTYFAALLAALHARRIGGWLDAYLPPRETALRAIVLLIGVAATYATVQLLLFRFAGFWPTDLPSYHYASLAVRRGLDPYDPKNLVGPPGQQIFPYIYPPLLALLWTPLTSLPLPVVFEIWQVISLIALWATLLCSIRLAGGVTPAGRTMALLAAFLVPFGLPTFTSAHHGAVSLVFTFLIALFFERLQRGRDRTAGAVLALACGLKALPFLLLPYLALKRRWRALAAALVTGAALLGLSVLALGWNLHWEFVTRIAPQIGYATHSNLGFDAVYYGENQSLNGVLSRLICPAGGCGAFIAIVCLAAAIPVAWRISRRREVDGAEAALVSILLLLVSPITWLHHLVLICVPAIVLAAAIADGRWRPRLWWVPVVALAAILAQDLGSLVSGVRAFVPWSDERGLMLVALYGFLLHVTARGARASVVEQQRRMKGA